MTLDEFSRKFVLLEKKEIEKVLYMAFFHRKTKGQDEFAIAEVGGWFEEIHLPRPNATRLRDNLTASKWFIKGVTKGALKVELKKFLELEKEVGSLTDDHEVKPSSHTVIDPAIWTGTRGYIESLAKQINSSYENNIFDGCAVLMRRLMEVLLILAYRELGIDGQIKDSQGNYQMLEKICANAISDPKLALSRDSKTAMSSVRDLGNYSAHKIEYLAKKTDLEKHLVGFRIIVEELLFKSALKK